MSRESYTLNPDYDSLIEWPVCAWVLSRKFSEDLRNRVS